MPRPLATPPRAQRVALLVSVTAALLTASPALAQSDDEETQQRLLISSVGLTTTGPFLSTSSLAGIGEKQELERLKEEEKRLRRFVWLERYLQDNPIEAREALAIGAGPGVEALAMLLGVSREALPATARAWRQDRARLQKILASAPSRQRTIALYDALDEAVQPARQAARQAHARKEVRR